MEEPSERPQRAPQPQAESAPESSSGGGAPVEVPKPANWDRMDDIERRLWLRENGQAPAPAPRSDRSEGGERLGREDRGRDNGNRRGGRGRRN